MPPSSHLNRIRQLISASSTQALLHSPNIIHSPGAVLAHHTPLETQPDSQTEYLERSQRSRTPSEKGALLAASNAQRRQTSARAQRGRARNAQKAARKAARSLESDYESIADGTQTEHPHDPEIFANQEETFVNNPTFQGPIDPYTAQLSRATPPPDHSLDVSSHSSRLPPPSIHGSSTVIAPPQPVAPGSGHHISHPAIQRQMKRSIDTNQPAAKRPRIEHTLSDAETEVPETEDEQSFHAPTSAQPLQRFRSSIIITSPPAPSPHPSRSPSPLPHQDSQVPPEDTQTIPEDPEVAPIDTQTIPETPTQHPVANTVRPAQSTLSQATPISLGASAPDPPRTQLDSRARVVSTEQPSPTATRAVTHPTSSTPVTSSRNTRTTRVRPTINEPPPASQPVPSTGTRSEPIEVSDDPPPTRTRGRGVRARGRGRGRGCRPGRTLTRGGRGRGRGSAIRAREGFDAIPPSERTVPRNLGVRREGATIGQAPTLPPDAPLPTNLRPIDNSSQSRIQPPSTTQQTGHRPNRPTTASTPRTVPGPLTINQPNHTSAATPSSAVRPPTGNRWPQPNTPAGPSSLTRTQPIAGPSNPSAQRKHWATRVELTGLDPVAQSVNRLRGQIAAIQPSNGVPTRPTSENGAELVSDDEEERAAEAAVAQGCDPNNRRQKPSSRNTHGVARLVLQLTKLHFWAYALTEGPYQTRAVFTMWARVMWRETWAMELPGVPSRDATDEEIQVIIAGLTTNRGRVKEHLRPIVEFILGFNRFAVTPEEVALNISVFERHHPNSFHCLEQEPERRGHYESELMHHAFALGLFHNEGSVGAVFREYFENMEPATVAFILANIQFCVEEWSTGRHENRDLSTGQMLAKFESHLMAWRQFRRVAPRRARTLTREWFEHGLHYSGAAQPAEEQGLLPSQAAEFRADTPTPEEPNEPNETLDEQARNPISPLELPSQAAKFRADTPTPEEPNEPNETLDEQVAYTEQIRELGLDEEFGEALGKGVGEGLMQEVDKEIADLWAREWVEDEEWEQAQESNEGEEVGEGEEDKEDNQEDEGPAAEESIQYYDDGRISAQSKGKSWAT
ncbi:unnamed protein product [Rhizoctonia solani]|uniref:DUF6532 domain-containing protein n=1 Tax=Rhizoctonia solani TaxID=456999 RepID=A0A8H3HDP4_9AGAM|nr:unnamed protein product [Rhizoctonia solani]